ncbi:MAG TPA: alpha/beta hydrolase [Kribbella sp.]|nr:alpha/beta hydrolase [Kribbella sp.]HZX04897.1 alpha/beta hydrolase [Kribbella sp.]
MRRTPATARQRDPRPGHGLQLAQSVQQQLGRYGVLLTYQGWGHGSYGKGPCMHTTIDNYLIDKDVPKRGTSCPAVMPA